MEAETEWLPWAQREVVHGYTVLITEDENTGDLPDKTLNIVNTIKVYT